MPDTFFNSSCWELLECAANINQGDTISGFPNKHAYLSICKISDLGANFLWRTLTWSLLDGWCQFCIWHLLCWSYFALQKDVSKDPGKLIMAEKRKHEVVMFLSKGQFHSEMERSWKMEWNQTQICSGQQFQTNEYVDEDGMVILPMVTILYWRYSVVGWKEVGTHELSM